MTVRELIHKLLDMPQHYDVQIEIGDLITDILPITDVYKGKDFIVIDTGKDPFEATE